MKNIYVALENIRSLHNIGAIFRTCSFFGITEILLVGYSGRNFDTKGRPVLHEEIKKSSLGTEKDLNIKFLDEPADLIKFSQEQKLKLFAIEQTEKSTVLGNIDFKESGSGYILVFGNEVTGVSAEVLEASDQTIEIAKKGSHNSLNVATVCGIVLYSATKDLQPRVS